jgi:uncharacterized protein YjiS (DUF1127 family)
MEGKASCLDASVIDDHCQRCGTPLARTSSNWRRTMVHLLSGERPSMAAASWNPLRALANWLAGARAKRARRVALESLLELDAHRLDDLGIHRQDLFEALDSPTQRPGYKLAQKRAESARNWLNR